MTGQLRLGRDRLGPAALLIIALVWGSTFFVIKDVLTRIPAADLLGVRFLIAATVLVAVRPAALKMDATTMRQGVVMGLLFSGGQLTQTLGLGHTSAAISGFLTGLYVVMTPLIEAGALRLGLPRRIWGAVGLAGLGLAVLTMLPGALDGGIGIGEALTVACALFYAVHIVFTGRVATAANSLSLTIVQSIVLAACCGLAALPGGVVLPASTSDWLVVIYLALICSSLTMFLQTWAQARVEATRAAIIMSSEPVWAAVFAVLFGGELLTGRLVFGGLAMMVGTWLAINTPLAPVQWAATAPSARSGLGRYLDAGAHPPVFGLKPSRRRAAGSLRPAAARP